MLFVCCSYSYFNYCSALAATFLTVIVPSVPVPALIAVVAALFIVIFRCHDVIAVVSQLLLLLSGVVVIFIVGVSAVVVVTCSYCCLHLTCFLFFRLPWSPICKLPDQPQNSQYTHQTDACVDGISKHR